MPLLFITHPFSLSVSFSFPLSFSLSLSLSLQVHVPNSCEFGSRGDVVEEAEFDDLVFVRDPEELRKDPLTCFFEGEHHTHGSHWTPQYNACFNCSCQVNTHTHTHRDGRVSGLRPSLA